LAPRGTIVVDNTLFKGYPYTEIKDYYGRSSGLATKRFNEVIVKDENLHKVWTTLLRTENVPEGISDICCKHFIRA